MTERNNGSTASGGSGGALLRARGVCKRFGAVRAVDGLDLDLERGEVVALLGPNGAGKSTSLRMLLGLIAPDEGEIAWWHGGRPAPQPLAQELGYLPEDRGLFREATVAQTVAYFGRLRGMGRLEARRAAERWLERLGLSQRSGEKPDALSKGNQQKVQWAAALVHNPSFAVLDEPFSGLDPLNQELFLEVLAELSRDGVGVLLSAHHLDLVERAAGRLVVLERGRMAFCGTVQTARASARSRGLRVRLEFSADPTEGNLQRLRGAAQVLSLTARGPRQVELVLLGDTRVSEWISALTRDLELASVEVRAPSLHEFYVDLVGAPKSGDGAVGIAREPS